MSSYAIWSLHKLLVFHAHKFFNISSTLTILENLAGEADNQPISESSRSNIMKCITDMRQPCLEMGLRLSVRQIGRIENILSDTPYEEVIVGLGNQILTLAVRIQDELQDCLFMQVSKDREAFFSDPRGQFGKSTLDKFPSLVSDVESAAKCYATGNPTAVVFHLMRIVECGLRALGKSLDDPNLDPKKNPSWDSILKKCDAELQKQIKDRSDLWRKENQFYSEATANIRAVKDAWRNPTMHIDQVYDDDQALAVFNTVKSFMRHLATKLSDGA